MNYLRFSKSLLLWCFVALIYGCGGASDHSELKNYVKSVKAKPARAIEPLPPFRPYESFVYSAAAERSPFDRPVDVTQRVYGRTGSDVKPDMNREKEYLESYELGQLTMVGTITKSGKLWALIADPTGFVTRVAEGNFIGKNHGRITSTAQTQIELLEIVSDGLEGWIERPRILALSEKD